MHELGKSLPDSKHAVSVSLPEWRDVIGYEEGEERVINTMELGYPRFVYHPLIKKLCAAAEAGMAKAGEFALCLPSEQVANWCIEFCGEGRIVPFHEIFVVFLPEGLRQKAKDFWQHSGFIVSSRQAESILDQLPKVRGNFARKLIRDRLAKLSGADAEDVYLYPSGMAAIFAAYRICEAQKTVQLGFPYVDTLKIQQKFGEVEFLKYDQLDKIDGENAIFTEFPLNPLLSCVDFDELKAKRGDAPLIIDDTLSSWANFKTLDHADIAVSSLTKFFSGIGDVLAGSLILNKNSKHYTRFKKLLDTEYEDLIFTDDAIVLAKNCADYEERIAIINDNTEKLYDWLKPQAKNFNILYTKDNPAYEKYKQDGYGGIISLVFEKEEQAEKFYNNLETCKGPSLGTEYTLACPYTLLAHYNELDWARGQGVTRALVRISVGQEDLEDLKSKFLIAMGTT